MIATIERVGIATAGAALLSLAILIAPGRADAQVNMQPPQTPPATQPAAAPQVQQQVLPQEQPAPPASAPQKDGFFDAFGKWWDKSAAEWDASMKKLKSTIDASNERNAQAARDAAAATKDATDALVKFPTTRIIEGRERCLLAPNGSPDCNAAAEKICKGKGFATGKSADIQSSRKCSARALLSRSEDDCVNETIVIKAACQ